MAGTKSKSRHSPKTIERLSLYRRVLYRAAPELGKHVHSHQIGWMCGATADQVRRDIMATGHEGSPNRGYVVSELLEAIDRYLGTPEQMTVALVGVGHLGRALLQYLDRRIRKFHIAAAFDSDRSKAGRVVSGIRCHPMEDLAAVIAAQGIRIGIVAVPAESAQQVADDLVAAGIEGIVNFAPAAMRIPAYVHLENIDLKIALEKVAFYTRNRPVAGRKR